MCSRRAAGFTLIEMIIAVVIISVGLAGVMLAFNTTVRSSADPLIQKQMLAIAEEMMEEVLLKPFAMTGTAPTNAATTCGTAGAVRSAFNDVSDYAGYMTAGICEIDGVAVAGLDGYNVVVAVNAAASLGDAASGGAVAGGDVKQVTVTVVRGGDSVVLTGWRTSYAL